MRIKKRLWLMLSGIVLSTAIMIAPAFSRPTEGEEMAMRGGRGMRNIVLAPVDILNTVEDVRFKEGLFSAISYGVIKGCGISAARLFYGLYEIGTFYDTDRNLEQFKVDYDSAIIRIS